MTKRNPRTANGHARRKLRARVKLEGRECGICHQPIDYSLPAGHPWSYELDEIIPVSLGGSPYDYNNVQAVHRFCNQKKGNKIIRQPALQPEKKKKKQAKIKQPRKKQPVKTVSNW